MSWNLVNKAFLVYKPIIIITYYNGNIALFFISPKNTELLKLNDKQYKLRKYEISPKGSK